MAKTLHEQMAVFVQERQEVLRSLDVDRVMAFFAKHSPRLSPMRDRGVAELAMHKARTADLTLTEDERKFSRQWLRERNSNPLL